MAGAWRSIWVGVGLAACTSAKAPAKPAPAVSREVAVQTPQAPEAPAAPPAAPPPELELEVLQAHLSLGLSIQNHSAQLQRFAPVASLVGEGKQIELRLSPSPDCLALAPGAEWLWPADWERTLAPDQRAVEGLSGTYHFELRGCAGGLPLRSEPVSLPLRHR